jgi:hypothetical protein
VENMIRSVPPMLSKTASRSRGSGGSSTGCVVTQMCSRTYADGGRVRCGDLVGQPGPVLVHPPHQRRQPAEAALDQHHPQLRELLEDALDDQAHHLAWKAWAMAVWSST